MPRHNFLQNTTSAVVTGSDEGCSDAQLPVSLPAAVRRTSTFSHHGLSGCLAVWLSGCLVGWLLGCFGRFGWLGLFGLFGWFGWFGWLVGW